MSKFLNHRIASLYNRCSLYKAQVRRASSESLNWANSMNKSLQETDPELFSIIQNEKKRQKDSLVLIASENFTSLSVFDALGSVMSNKYSEGYPGARYYGGNENIDKAEILCQERALKAFNLVKRIDHIIGIFIYTYIYI